MFRHVIELDEPQWDSLATIRGFYRSSGWLRHAEATADNPPAYLAVTSGSRYLAGTPVYPLTTQSPFVFCRPDFVLAQQWPAAAAWLPELMPTLSCGGRNPGHTRVGLCPDTNEAMHLTSAVVTAAEDHARELGLASVNFMYVDDDDSCLRSVLESAGYVCLPAETAYQLSIATNSFSGYLMTLPSRQRTAVHRDLRRLEAANITYRALSASPSIVDQISAMEAALYARHGTPVDAATLAEVNTSIMANTDCRIVLAYREDQPCGFATAFTFANELYARQVGFDYTITAGAPVYFGVLFYELIRLAQAEGLTRIHYGVGSDYEKRSRGAAPIPQHTYVRAFSPQTQERLLQLSLTTR